MAGMFPVSAVQGFMPETVDLPVVSTEVVVYWQVQLEIFKLVLPLTVAVSVSDCDTITVAVGGNTETLTTLLVLPPPQPARDKNAAAARPSAASELILSDFVTTRTPKILIRPRSWPNKVSEIKSGNRRVLQTAKEPKRSSEAAQNVLLTVNRNVVAGSK
jgi:hypothetical protein